MLKLHYCLSNALHTSIGQNRKSFTCVSGVRCPVSDVRSKCEKLQMAITQQRIDFVYGSRVGFSGTLDRMAPFTFGSNPRWRPMAIFKKLQMAISQQCVI